MRELDVIDVNRQVIGLPVNGDQMNVNQLPQSSMLGPEACGAVSTVGFMCDVGFCDLQEDHKMRMREWVEYYTNPAKKKTLNVISLEFSQTRLVRQSRTCDLELALNSFS